MDIREGEKLRASPPTTANTPSIEETSGQYERDENMWRRSGRRFPSEWLGSFIGFLILIIILVATVLYALNGQPLFPIETRLPYASSQQPILETQPLQFPEPAFIVLGDYNGKFYTFNRGVKKVYVYDPTNEKEDQVCSLVEFDAFWWHNSGKVLVLSHAYDTLGSIYVLDLAQSKPKPILITNRETAPQFPRNLSMVSSLPLAWAESGDAIAFVAQDVKNNTESLFIFETTSNQLVYTPARNLERISSIIWTEGDKQLALVAISDGQENRYFVDRQGGQFAIWNIKD